MQQGGGWTPYARIGLCFPDSVFKGLKPEIHVEDTKQDEIAAVAAWLELLQAKDIQPHEIGVFVRSDAKLDRAKTAVEKAGLPYRVLDHKVDVVMG